MTSYTSAPWDQPTDLILQVSWHEKSAPLGSKDPGCVQLLESPLASLKKLPRVWFLDTSMLYVSMTSCCLTFLVAWINCTLVTTTRTCFDMISNIPGDDIVGSWISPKPLHNNKYSCVSWLPTYSFEPFSLTGSQFSTSTLQEFLRSKDQLSTRGIAKFLWRRRRISSFWSTEIRST